MALAACICFRLPSILLAALSLRDSAFALLSLMTMSTSQYVRFNPSSSCTLPSTRVIRLALPPLTCLCPQPKSTPQHTHSSTPSDLLSSSLALTRYHSLLCLCPQPNSTPQHTHSSTPSNLLSSSLALTRYHSLLCLRLQPNSTPQHTRSSTPSDLLSSSLALTCYPSLLCLRP